MEIGWPSHRGFARSRRTPQPSNGDAVTIVVWLSVPHKRVRDRRPARRSGRPSVKNRLALRYRRFTWWQMPGCPEANDAEVV